MVVDNACELELPEAMKIHPVVNVSQVKKYHGSLQRPPPIEIDGLQQTANSKNETVHTAKV